jgi:hypothetical protein
VYLKRSLSLVGVLGVAAAILIATAGAARGPEKPHAKFHFTSTATVLKYLKSHGVNTRGMVVQRGVRNYAGPKCPGKGWNCTRARHVIQFALAATSSTFSCSPSYGTPAGPFPPTPTAVSPDTCIVVQVNTTGDNNAKCIEQTSADGANQYCEIYQENVSGKNNAAIVQLINESSGQHQTGDQDARVTQQNGSGPNNSAVTQTIWQTTSTNGPTVDQNQQGRQNNDIDQTATAGGTQFSVMSQAVVQKATAGRERDWDFAPFAAAVFSGSQNQYGDGRGTVNQMSTGVSKSYNFQNMLQTEKAPKNSGVSQDQIGPYRCCSSQQSNPADVFYLEQAKGQFTTSAAASSALYEDGFLDTAGHGHIDQFANQNGATNTTICDVNAGSCAREIGGVNGVYTNSCPPIICSDFAALSSAGKASPNHRAFGLHRNR